jgi:hypothetical protein
MIIYLDESYDWQGTYFLLGALFIVDNHDVFLGSFDSLKREEKFFRKDGITLQELKYSNINYPRTKRLAVKAIQTFRAQQQCYFRAVIIPQAQFDLRHFGKNYEQDNIKRARAYKKFAEMLIEYNTPEVKDAVLFADDLSRCKANFLGQEGDEFLEAMRQRFQYVVYDDQLKGNPRKLRHISEVNSAHDKYALLQVCDVLLGSTLNGILKLHKGPGMVYKNEVTAKMMEILELPTLDKGYWQPLVKLYSKEYRQKITMADYLKATHHKYRLWFWRPPKEKA